MDCISYLLCRLCGEGNSNPLQSSCLDNPTDGGAWWATVHGAEKSLKRLSDFPFTFPPFYLPWSDGTRSHDLTFLFLFFYLSFIYSFYFTILYWFCHTSTWIHHGCTCVPHPEPPSHLPPHPIPLGHPSAPAPSILSHALNLDWWFISYMIVYMFQCHSHKSSHPLPLPQSPKDCSIHLCLFCCLAYRLSLPSF